MADNDQTQDNNDAPPAADEGKSEGKKGKGSRFDQLRSSVRSKDGETFLRAVVTRLVKPEHDDEEPTVFVRPLDDVSQLELDGHRLSSGELVLTHNRPGLPQQFDPRRAAVDGDMAVGKEIGLVHLDKRRR
jgi:hypothetical protein